MCIGALAYEEHLGSSNQTVGEDAVGATVVKVGLLLMLNVGDIIAFSSADASSMLVKLCSFWKMKVMNMKLLQSTLMT